MWVTDGPFIAHFGRFFRPVALRPLRGSSLVAATAPLTLGTPSRFVTGPPIPPSARPLSLTDVPPFVPNREWNELSVRHERGMDGVSDRRAVHRSLRSLLPSRSATPAPRLFARGRRTAPLLVPRRSLITSPFGTGSARWTGAPHCRSAVPAARSGYRVTSIPVIISLDKIIENNWRIYFYLLFTSIFFANNKNHKLNKRNKRITLLTSNFFTF